MPPRILNFLPLDALFFILNILGHDVYHDFGSDSGRLIDSMAALNMINSFLGLAGGTKVKSQNARSQRKPNYISQPTQLEYTTPSSNSLYTPQNLNIKIPLKFGQGQGQRLRQSPVPKLSPNSERRARAIAAQGRNEYPSDQPTPKSSDSKFSVDEAEESKKLEEAEAKVEAAKQKYDAKSPQVKNIIKSDAYITYIAENIQIAYEFNVFKVMLLTKSDFLHNQERNLNKNLILVLK